MSDTLRITGLATGIDTDSVIKSLMRVENMKVDKAKQDVELLEWKKDAYRDITNILRGFKDEYFDVLKPETNFRSETAFNSFDITSGDESIVTATGTKGAQSKTHDITVTSLASAAKIEGINGMLDAVKGSGTISDYNLQGKQIKVTLDGSTKNIDLEDYGDAATLETNLEAALKNAFGKTASDESKIDVVMNGDTIEFQSRLNGSTFSVAEAPNNFISSLGFSNNQKNYVEGNDIYTDNWSVYDGGEFKLDYDGNEYTISISNNPTTLNDLQTEIQNEINTAIGIGNIEVTNDGSKFTFKSNTKNEMKLLSGDNNNVLDKLGVASGTTIRGISSRDIDLSENVKGKSFSIDVNGTEETITLTSDYSSVAALATDLQTELDSLFGAGTVTVTNDADKLAFSSSEKIIFKKGPEDTLDKLGFSDTGNKSNKISMNSSLDSIKSYFANDINIPDPTAEVQFTINNVDINLDKSYEEATLDDVMTAINTSSAGVEMTYDSLNGKFTLTSKAEGYTSDIEITNDTSDLLIAMGIDQTNLVGGTDAVFTLDGVTEMQRSSNEFTVDGVNYTLKNTGTTTIDIKKDVDGLFDRIKGFVEKYNETISKINSELNEEKDRDYKPLTAEQKEAMSETEIENWEEKAKSGLLRNDSILQSIASSMRTALYDQVEGVNISLYDIGITTSSNYKDGGKLVINETKLKEAINEDYAQIVDLFTKESEYSYDDGENRSNRYKEEGLAERLYDTIEDNIRITRGSNGRKGILLEKAGIEGDVSDFDNLLSDKIESQQSRIDDLLDSLVEKEDYYYQMFARMESAIAEMNSQSEWLQAQLGGLQ